jgi:LPXTG-site transpeptidase (sortase) family protein
LSRLDLRARLVLFTALVIALWSGAACSVGPSNSTVPAIPEHSRTVETTLLSTSTPPVTVDPTASASEAVLNPDGVAPTMTPSTKPLPVRQGADAHSAGFRFVPGTIELSSGNSAVVEPEQTVDGALQVPADTRRVGWWDGSAYAGDPFGSTVLAGHVDSREQGLGFFAELLLVQVGDLVTVRSDAHVLTYRVASTNLVNKDALASEGQALDQHGPHRLVLITCSGQWHADIRSYDSNLVVVAEPVLP